MIDLHQANDQHFPLVTSSFPNRQSLDTQLSGDAALTYILGGTSVRIVLQTTSHPHPISTRLTWEEYRQRPENDGKNIAGMADLFTFHLARMTREFLEAQGITPQQIKGMGLSVAGFVEGSGKNQRITTSNTGVDFKNFELSKKLLRELSGSGSGDPHWRKQMIRVLNDGFSAVTGEYLHPEGLLRGVKKGILIIVGTGIGGGGIEDGEIVLGINELGHIFLFNNKTQRYEHWPLERLKEEGYLKNYRYTGTPEGYTYLEHRLAGPWIAIRFVKSLGDDSGLLDELAEQAGINKEALQSLEGLPRADRDRWASKVNDSIIRPINDYVFKTSLPDYVASRYSHAIASRLTVAAFDYKLKVFNEFGEALAAMRKAFPDYRIVLGSGVAERLADDSTFLPIVQRVAGASADDIKVSHLDALQRESAWVSQVLWQ